MSPDQIISAGLVGVLLLVLGGLLFYLYRLRVAFYNACRKSNNLSLFAECPMGLPVGTVRSTLTLLVVLFALGYVAIAGVSDVPDGLTAIVSVVLGFYFGSRASGTSWTDVRAAIDEIGWQQTRPSDGRSDRLGGARAAPAPVSATAAANRPPASRSEHRDARDLLRRLQDGRSVTEVVRSVLPQSLRREFASIAYALQTGVDTVQGLLAASEIAAARQEGRALLERYRHESPLRTIVERAQTTFEEALKADMQARSLVGTIVNVVSVQPEGYERWKARLLHLPVDRADVPLDRVDDDSAAPLLKSSPILEEAFQEELAANDRTFLRNVTAELLSVDDVASLWEAHADRFESRKQFEDGVAALRRAATDVELRDEMDASLFEGVGGYDRAMKAIDQLHADEAAEGALDVLVTASEALYEAESVKTALPQLFEDVRRELESVRRGAAL